MINFAGFPLMPDRPEPRDVFTGLTYQETLNQRSPMQSEDQCDRAMTPMRDVMLDACKAIMHTMLLQLRDVEHELKHAYANQEHMQAEIGKVVQANHAISQQRDHANQTLLVVQQEHSAYGQKMEYVRAILEGREKEWLDELPEIPLDDDYEDDSEYRNACLAEWQKRLETSLSKAARALRIEHDTQRDKATACDQELEQRKADLRKPAREAGKVKCSVCDKEYSVRTESVSCPHPPVITEGAKQA